MKKSNHSIVVPTRLAAATRRGTLSDGPAGRGRGALSVATVGLFDVEMAPTCEGDPPVVRVTLPHGQELFTRPLRFTGNI